MALVCCPYPDCGRNEVSDSGKCPYCGRDVASELKRINYEKIAKECEKLYVIVNQIIQAEALRELEGKIHKITCRDCGEKNVSTIVDNHIFLNEQYCRKCGRDFLKYNYTINSILYKSLNYCVLEELRASSLKNTLSNLSIEKLDDLSDNFLLEILAKEGDDNALRDAWKKEKHRLEETMNKRWKDKGLCPKCGGRFYKYTGGGLASLSTSRVCDNCGYYLSSYEGSKMSSYSSYSGGGIGSCGYDA